MIEATEIPSPTPFWSVMVPAYNPRRDYLEQMLSSVLEELPERGHARIEVVDDCSPDVDVAEIVRSIAGDNVAYSRTPQNLGLAGCWNACIERSRGAWVHILHQDDWVLPGFYRRFEELFQRVPGLGAASARFMFGDEKGLWKEPGGLLATEAAELKNFPAIIGTSVAVQCASVVVKKTTYEALGTFRTDLPYVLDWEMWCRIAGSYPWGYVPELGAVYRQHPGSETTRLQKAGRTFRDLFDGGKMGRAHLAKDVQVQTERKFRDLLVEGLLADILAMYARGQLAEGRQMLDDFQNEGARSSFRRDWRWLRFRFATKAFRNRLQRSHPR